MRFLVGLALVLVALSGCSDDGPSEASKLNPSTSTSTTTSTTTTQTSQPAPQPEPTPSNTAPSVVLSASPASGTAPLEVVFTLNGTDADGDALTWSLDLDGDGIGDVDGSDLPAQHTATLDAGNHTATLTVDDGQETATSSVEIQVAAPEAPAPEGPIQVVDGTYTVPFEGCTIAYPSVQAGQDLATLAGGDLDEVSRVQFDVDPATYGLPFTVTWSHDVGYLYAALAFTDAEGTVLGSVGTDPTAQEAGMGDLSKEGTVPADAVFGIAWTCGGPTEASVHYEA